jgi:hypothetical protein
MGAGLWNRGNVLVGLYGMWHDGPPQRPPGAGHLHGVRIDLGLLVSSDGIHFREPVPDFKVIPHGQEGEWDCISLLQGHAFANVGDQTYIWYSHWDSEGRFRSQEIGLATLRRDGFGYLSRHHPQGPGHFVTSTIEPATAGTKLYVNVTGTGPDAPLTVGLLDAADRPLPHYSGPDAATIVSDGTRCEVVWPASRSASIAPDQPWAVKATFPKSGDVRVYALYAERR